MEAKRSRDTRRGPITDREGIGHRHRGAGLCQLGNIPVFYD